MGYSNAGSVTSGPGQRHDIDVESDSAEAGHNALMTEAEAIKRATENKIREVESSA